MAFERMTEEVRNVSALPNVVVGQASNLKATFDEAGSDLKLFINNFLAALESSTASANIGILNGELPSNVQTIVDDIIEDISDTYTKAETVSLVNTNTTDLVKDFNIDLNTGIITITKKDGTIQTYDTSLEKVPATFELIEEEGNYFLKITNVDGTSSRTNITELFNDYTFNNSETVAITTVKDGNKATITADIRDASIGIEKLSLTAISQLEGYVASASASASSASASATSASNSASSALGSANAAALAANSAADRVSEASNFATNASTSASEASSSATTASNYATVATNQAVLSKSWAVGDTGVREGEGTNNAKYWASQAQAAAGGGTLNTDNTASQPVSSNESLKGNVNLHKVSKTGNYSDLNGLPIIPAKLSQLSTDETHRTVTDIEKNTWNGKANASDIKTALSELTDDSTHRTVTDAEKNAWNANITKVNELETTVDNMEDAIGEAQGLQGMFKHDVLTVNKVSTPKALKSNIYGGLSSEWSGTCVGNKDGRQHTFRLSSSSMSLQSGQPSAGGNLYVWPIPYSGAPVTIESLSQALQHTGSDSSSKIQFGMRGNNSRVYRIYFYFTLDTSETPSLRYNGSYNLNGFTATISFEYSDNNSTWTAIKTQTFPTSYSDKFYYINNANQTHKYWRAMIYVVGDSSSYSSSTLVLNHLSLTNVNDTSYEYRNDFTTSKPFVEGESKKIKAPSNIDLTGVTANTLNGINFYKLIYPNEEYDVILENNTFKNNIGLLKNASGTLGSNASVELSFLPKLVLYVVNGNIKAITPNGKTITNPESATITYCAIY